MTTPTILPDNVLTALISLFVPLAAVAATVALKIWSQYRSQWSDLSITSAVEYRQHTFEGEFAEILEPLLDDLEVATDGGVTKSKLRDTIDADSLTDEDIMRIVEAWRSISEVTVLKEAYSASMKASYRSFALLSLGLMTLPIMTFLTLYTGGTPFTWSWDLAHATVGLFNAALLFRGIVKFKRANGLHERLERLNETHRAA